MDMKWRTHWFGRQKERYYMMNLPGAKNRNSTWSDNTLSQSIHHQTETYSTGPEFRLSLL